MRFRTYTYMCYLLTLLSPISDGFHAPTHPGHSILNDTSDDNDRDLDSTLDKLVSNSDFQDNDRSKEIPAAEQRWLQGSEDRKPKRYKPVDVSKSPADHVAENIPGIVHLNFMLARDNSNTNSRLHAEDALTNKPNKKRLPKALTLQETSKTDENKYKNIEENEKNALPTTAALTDVQRRGNLVIIPNESFTSKANKNEPQYFFKRKHEYDDPIVMSGGSIPFPQQKIVILPDSPIHAYSNPTANVIVVQEEPQPSIVVLGKKRKPKKKIIVPVYPPNHENPRFPVSKVVPRIVPEKARVGGIPAEGLSDKVKDTKTAADKNNLYSIANKRRVIVVDIPTEYLESARIDNIENDETTSGRHSGGPTLLPFPDKRMIRPVPNYNVRGTNGVKVRNPSGTSPFEKVPHSNPSQRRQNSAGVSLRKKNSETKGPSKHRPSTENSRPSVRRERHNTHLHDQRHYPRYRRIYAQPAAKRIEDRRIREVCRRGDSRDCFRKRDDNDDESESYGLSGDLDPLEERQTGKSADFQNRTNELETLSGRNTNNNNNQQHYTSEGYLLNREPSLSRIAFDKTGNSAGQRRYIV